MSLEITRLDTTGLNCPLPILRTRKALNDVEVGQILEVTSTDPGAVRDFEAFCKQTKNILLSSYEDDGAFVFEIRKAN